jgi:hypothetical protein
MYVSESKVKKNINGQSNVSLYSSRAIRFRGARNSANQVSRGWEFDQSGFERLGVQSITWVWCSGVLQSGNQMEGPYFITLEKLLFSFRNLDLWLVEKGHHPEELF